jgi:hypothetical protein
MNAAQILTAMLDAAAPVVKSYWTDIRHDARLISEAPATSAFLWAPYEMGTRIVMLQHGDMPNAMAAELFAAMDRPSTPQWYYVCVGMGDFAPVSREDAQTSALGATQRATDAKAAGEAFLSQINL